MKNLKLLAALLALTIGLAGCGGSSKGGSSASSASQNKLDGDGMTASPSAKQEYTEPEDVTYMRLLAGEAGYRVCVLYLGGSYEITTDVQKVLDSLQEQPWQFVTDIPADHRVTAPGGGRELYCLFAVCREDTLFVYEKQDPQYPHQTGRELYCKQDGQPILLLCNGTPDTPDITAVVYCTTGRALDWSPRLSAGTGSPEPVEGVDVFSNHPASGAAP